MVSPEGFRQLSLRSGWIGGVTNSGNVASVEMRLLNDTNVFTCFSNLVPGTSKLNGFDLLAAASNAPALAHQTFHTLECILPKEFEGESTEVMVEFEVV